MGRGSVPGEFEQLVLLTLAGFEDEVTGRQVYDSLVTATGRDVSVAAVHITLNRLEEKHWVRSRTSAPEPGQGGKPRRHYRLSPEGARLLTHLRHQHDQLWDAAREHPLLGEQ